MANKKNHIAQRKTPVQSRSEETVNVILQAAAQVLTIHGVDGYNTNRIAERAGVSIGTLYQYFPNKDSIMAALIKLDSQKLYTRLKEVMESNGDRNQKVYALIAVAVSHQFETPRLGVILDNQQEKLPLDKENEDFRAKIARLVGALVAEFDITESDIPDVSRDLVNIVRGMVDDESRQKSFDQEAVEMRAGLAAMAYLKSSANKQSQPNA